MQSSWQRNPVEWKRLVSQVSLSCSRVNSEVQSSERDGLLGQFVMQLTMTSSWVRDGLIRSVCCTAKLTKYSIKLTVTMQLNERDWLTRSVCHAVELTRDAVEWTRNAVELTMICSWVKETGLVRSVCHTVKLTRNAVELTVACSWVKETGWWGHFIWYHFQFCGQGYHKDLSSPRFHFTTGVILCLTSPWYTVMVDWA